MRGLTLQESKFHSCHTCMHNACTIHHTQSTNPYMTQYIPHYTTNTSTLQFIHFIRSLIRYLHVYSFRYAFWLNNFPSHGRFDCGRQFRSPNYWGEGMYVSMQAMMQANEWVGFSQIDAWQMNECVRSKLNCQGTWEGSHVQKVVDNHNCKQEIFVIPWHSTIWRQNELKTKN